MEERSKFTNTQKACFGVPILFLIFNRPDTTKQVFEEIRKAAPQKLYVASDGPRENREEEKEKVEAIREYILESINWDCEVKTLFREKNLGCGKGPAQAITWFFENEEMGIILEDDCLPSQSFFSYCEELLKKYEFDSRIYHIAGFNPLTITETPLNSSYYFARIEHCWGWASWRRAWKEYSFEIIDLDDFIKKNTIKKVFNRKEAQKYWINLFKNIPKGEKDFWDFQWTYSIFKNEGVCINPAKNLVSNIGFGEEATHTKDKNTVFCNQKRYEIDTIIHPDIITIDNHIINEINKKAFGIHWYYYFKKKIKQVLRRIINYKNPHF